MPLASDHRQRKPASSFAAVLGDIVAALGRIAIGVVIASLLLVGLRQSKTISKSMDQLLPDFVVDWFDEGDDAPAPKPSRPQARSELSKALDPQPFEKPAAGFGIGSSEEEVRSIQGTPHRVAPGIWFYGESEVHFVAGRVAAWRESKANPLRLR